MAFVGKRKLLMVLPGLLLMSASFSSLSAGAAVDGCSSNVHVIAVPRELDPQIQEFRTPVCSIAMFGPRIVVRGHADGIGLVGMTIQLFDGDALVGTASCGPALNTCDTVAATFGPVQLARIVCMWTGGVAINGHVSCDAESSDL